MALYSVKEIRERGREIVFEHPEGIRFSEIVNTIIAESPKANVRTIATTIAGLLDHFPIELEKPSRGFYKPRTSTGTAPAVALPAETPPSSVHEDDFYEAFSDYLRNDLDEVTRSASVGGAGLKTKWGTPDVVGIYRPKVGALLPFEPEIVTAEIKVDPTQPVVAFGQAAAYRLFSHKVYLVLPESMTEDDQSRIEALALLFGVGLVLFDPEASKPVFSIRVRAQRSSPDPFYLNEFADRFRTAYPDKFEHLFG